MASAARVGDMHTCPATTGVVPHVGGPVLPPGVAGVLVGGLPAAVVGTSCACIGPPDTIVSGSATVLIGGRPAARVGSGTAHLGSVAGPGCTSVLIGG
ncbi:MAG TPA: PAAR domain-containing protein [Gaiellaceae bacterium]|nr:PAAR domain-containing protein [Gaiellaceae bacterium]